MSPLKKKHKNLLTRSCKIHARNMKKIIWTDCRPCTALNLFSSQSPAALAFWNLVESGCPTKDGGLNKVSSGAAFLWAFTVWKFSRKEERCVASQIT